MPMIMINSNTACCGQAKMVVKIIMGIACDL
jgi:hypothetical protein